MKRAARIGFGVFAALLLSCGMLYAGDYNLNPAWCGSHSFLDDPVRWLEYECWLPNPTGDPY